MLNRIPPSPILNRASIKHHLPIASHQIRFYSFESGRKPKSGPSLNNPNPDQLSPTNHNETGDSKPIVISGRGRRLNHRSNSSNPFSSTPQLTLPFKPLSANHLAHLRPTTLFLDLFFSLQRPLLEIELSPNQRRSITAETRESILGLESDQKLESPLAEEDQDENVYPQINFGSPSDPAFKQPHLSSSDRHTIDQNELDDQIGPTFDPYSSFLITEPEGVNPAWSDALKRCLATSQAFLPPPPPQQEDHSELYISSRKAKGNPSSTIEPEQCQANLQVEHEIQLDTDRKKALNFLAPYGLVKSSKTTTDRSHPQSQTHTVDGDGRMKSHEDSFQPGIAQDPLSLTIQAARFLHSVMMANRWPEAANWLTIESKLTAAEQTYHQNSSTATVTTHDDRLQKKSLIMESSSFPPVRGSERPIHSGRRNRPNNNSIRWIQIHAEIDGSNGRKKHSILLNIQQLEEIIIYSHKLLNNKIKVESIPKNIFKNLEQFGEVLIRKSIGSSSNFFKNSSFFNNQNIVQEAEDTNKSQDSLIPVIPIVVIEDPSQVPSSKIHDHQSNKSPNEIINLDSVFRKKKRKMKVHKYKKRRKARRTLKKRQGK